MASLRYVAVAYSYDDASPTEILTKLSRVLDVVRDCHFATVLNGLPAFTDGLVERRGEPIDHGLERLRQRARGPAADSKLLLDTLLTRFVSDLEPQGLDDIALLGIRRAP